MIQLGNTTFDNATNNDTLCAIIERLHSALELGDWNAVQNQLMCVYFTVLSSLHILIS